jgi:pimeloyl-ACP methyl ester carboxylesterase
MGAEVIASAWHRGTAAKPLLRWWWHAQLKKPLFGRFMKTWRWPQGVSDEGWQHARVASESHASIACIVKETMTEPVRGVVVCAHPMGLAAKGFWLRNGHADALLGEGFHVVAFDFNGFGESASTNFDYPADALAVGRWARARFLGLRVHALTASFGAMNTISAMGLSDFPFQCVVAEGCAHSLAAFWKAYPFVHAMLELSRWVAPASERRLRPELQVRLMPPQCSLLLVHSRADRWTPVQHGDRIASAAPLGRRVHRLVLERAEHTQGMRDEPHTYWPAVRKFLLANEGPDVS